jgi:hypothetical protein
VLPLSSIFVVNNRQTGSTIHLSRSSARIRRSVVSTSQRLASHIHRRAFACTLPTPDLPVCGFFTKRKLNHFGRTYLRYRHSHLILILLPRRIQHRTQDTLARSDPRLSQRQCSVWTPRPFHSYHELRSQQHLLYQHESDPALYGREPESHVKWHPFFGSSARPRPLCQLPPTPAYLEPVSPLRFITFILLTILHQWPRSSAPRLSWWSRLSDGSSIATSPSQ